ncbi:unnamed protein product [Brassicogethes aeneus]|uniref:Uncharacterized protein n=1 Tax=Brassicogethes aeneus TaxID=1431903 RepID=A0A9P0F946_BRAAE|nr:unnamed protein product [Brassicogethes aeneus]
MNTSLVLFLIGVLVSCCLCRSSTYNYMKFKEHNTYVVGFKCGTPQPRIVNSSTIIKDTKDLHPRQTVLYKCDCTGVCIEEGTYCGPKKTENVTLYFRYLGTQEIVTGHAVNETDCDCINIHPDFTVLYQCDCTGVCQQGMICSAIEFEEITLYFKNLETSELFGALARNETACGCVLENGKIPDCK